MTIEDNARNLAASLRQAVQRPGDWDMPNLLSLAATKIDSLLNLLRHEEKIVARERGMVQSCADWLQEANDENDLLRDALRRARAALRNMTSLGEQYEAFVAAGKVLEATKPRRVSTTEKH